MRKINYTKHEKKISFSLLALCITFVLLLGTSSSTALYGQSTTTEVLTSPTSSWQCPEGVTSISVEMWGAGGGGGGTSSNSNKAGGGGAGGSYVKNTDIAVTPGTTYNINIGVGGVGVSGNNNKPVPVAGSGGNTTVTFDITTMTAIGGAGGTCGVYANASGIGGEAASTGNSGFSDTYSYYGTAGETGSGMSGGYGGAGGIGAGSGGEGGVRKTVAGGGNAGAAPGGGGGGAYTTTTFSKKGGNGGDGQILISYTSASPLVINPTVDSITASSATLGATIASDGGSAITERGTVWATTPGVTINDNKLAEGSTSTGVFSHSRIGMNPKSLCYYRAYATNAIGTRLSSESSFYTKATQPAITNSISAIEVDGENTELDVSWSEIPDADGYLVLMRDGDSAPETDPMDGTIYTVGTPIGSAIVAAVVYSAEATSIQLSGLAPGATYTFSIAAFGYDGTNAATMNYAPIVSTLSETATLPIAAEGQTTTLLETRYSSGTGSWTSRQAKLVTLLPAFTPIVDAAELDVNKYGSSNQLSETATGFFYTKKIGDRWWIIDPEGKAQLNIAMNSITIGNDSVLSAAGNRLWELGFNGIGNFLSDEDQTIRYNNTHTNQFSYTRRINFYLSYNNNRKDYYPITPSGANGNLGYVFVLDPKFAEYCDNMAKKLEQYKNEKNLLGYFIDNEINFNQDQLQKFLQFLSPGDPSYDAALDFATANGLTKEQVVAGQASNEVLKKFAGVLAEHYYEVTTTALKKYDPNHMVLGSRLHGRPRGIDGVVKAAAKWCDIVSVNFYDNYSPNAEITNANKYLTWIDKPCIVGEFYVKAVDAVTAGWCNNYSGAGWTVKTQTDRGAWYQNTCIELLKSRIFVGWHWFKYKDDGANRGIVKNDTNGNEEHYKLTNQMTLLNNNRFKLANYFDGTNTSVASNLTQSISIIKSFNNIIIDGIEEKSTLRIYDVTGKIIMAFDIYEKTKTFSLNELKKGIYVFRINTVSGRNQYVSKIII